MYKILEKKGLNPTVIQLWIEAPLVARKAKPGQFIILRVDEQGEARSTEFPFTSAALNPWASSMSRNFCEVATSGKNTTVRRPAQ